MTGAEVALVDKGGATVIQVSIADSRADSCRKQRRMISLPEEVVIDRQSLSVIERPDHLELKLQIVASLGEGNWGAGSSSSNTEMKTFQEKGCFACGGCGQPVVEQGIKHFFPMPSENWEELADHWFDLQCGCGGPVKASNLARKVQARLVPTRATCLVGTTSYLLHESDLVASGGQKEREWGSLPNGLPVGNQPLNTERAVTESLERSSSDGAGSSEGDATSREVLQRRRQSVMHVTDEQSLYSAATMSPAFETPESVPIQRNNSQDEDCEPTASKSEPSNEFDSSRLDEGREEESGVAPASCCGHVESAADVAVELAPERIQELAEGPIEPTEPLTGAHKWIRVRCPCCTETLGVRRATEDQTTASPGVYLFKHRVVLCGGASTSPSRKITREALLAHFSARLQQAAEQSLCSRFLLQGLLTGKPYCHVTVLSRETFVWSGLLNGSGDGSQRSQGLKVLLTYPSDAVAGTPADPKRSNQFERVFLLEDDAEELLRILVANNEKYPLSCRTLNRASLSFL
ncbi:hypothetical protein KFL_001520150 [Klebsormidium nitens]|uniref:Uncharacterized protein n=1 Tax=Klebsormidium nitens TaxID=105231 RepID=A0A1Y1HY22_KLENI|nr:hypothetical protein KFL_001520150 [Klebsormidium nitens]|eukprot:GAQ83545.1 hypothetical protein KFL_001520150 [Klebsormidium nitens]